MGQETLRKKDEELTGRDLPNATGEVSQEDVNTITDENRNGKPTAVRTTRPTTTARPNLTAASELSRTTPTQHPTSPTCRTTNDREPARKIFALESGESARIRDNSYSHSFA